MDDEFCLILVPSKNDQQNSNDYQSELRTFYENAKPTSQRCFTRDSIDGGISSLGEFIYNNSETIIYALAYVVSKWIQSKEGRKVRVKIRDNEYEASSVDEIKELINILNNNYKKRKK